MKYVGVVWSQCAALPTVSVNVLCCQGIIKYYCVDFGLASDVYKQWHEHEFAYA